jgi:putative ABC transport system permease protein
MLIDLEYADRLAGDSGVTQGAEVWLAPDAPSSIVDALAAAGLTVTAERTLSGERTLLSRTGGALGMRFSLLAGVAAVVLGAAGLLVTAMAAAAATLGAGALIGSRSRRET